jgi:hypothetical protein
MVFCYSSICSIRQWTFFIPSFPPSTKHAQTQRHTLHTNTHNIQTQTIYMQIHAHTQNRQQNTITNGSRSKEYKLLLLIKPYQTKLNYPLSNSHHSSWRVSSKQKQSKNNLSWHDLMYFG